MQNLWQLHYQIYEIISWNKFTKLSVKNVIVFFEYESVKENSIKYKCLSCNKKYSNKIDEGLKNRFKNIFKFSNNDINRFILLLRKCVYSYGYMDEWEKFNETLFPKKEEF